MANDIAAFRDILASTEFFADAPSEILDSLAVHGEERQLVRGDVLFNEGDPPDALYVVTSGRLAIALSNPIDRRESVIALMEEGDLFGELGLLDDRPRSAMARALESSRVLTVPYAPVVKMFNDHPTMLWNVTRLLAQRLRVMDEALADSVFLDVTGRTAKRILELADGVDQLRPAGHPGGAGRDGRGVQGTRQQGDRQLHPSRMVGAARSAVHDHPTRPPRVAGPVTLGATWTIVVAGGSGTRFGSAKQFELVGVDRVIDRACDVARRSSDGLVVVLPSAEDVATSGATSTPTRPWSVG